MKKKLLFIFILIISFFFQLVFFSKPSSATQYIEYSISAPPGPYIRGKDIRFTISVKVQDAILKTAQIGLTYETQYLQFISVIPGNAMTTVTSSQVGAGKMILAGANPQGFTGEGVYAYVDFKLIADAAGETELCTLWEPIATPTPTPGPTATPGPTSTPGPSPTASPLTPTKLPTSGQVTKTSTAAFLGVGLIIAYVFFFLFDRKNFFKKPKKS